MSAFVFAPHPDFPPPPHTGGFGEPTCQACHTGEALNAPGGTLRLEGVPRRWRPGAAYRIAVVLRRDSLARAGFELAARFVPGGAQAGTLEAGDTLRAEVTRDSLSGIPYLHQTRPGARVSPGEGRWQVIWRAPASRGGTVAFNVAAVASNDDDSNLGDAVYTATAVSSPR